MPGRTGNAGTPPPSSGDNQILVGTKGYLATRGHGDGVRLLPNSRWADYKLPPQSLTRSPGHQRDWVRACKGGKPASSNFDFSGPLSEMVLMGNLAVRYPNRKLLWDGEKMEVTNDADANAYVRRHYREGWSL